MDKQDTFVIIGGGIAGLSAAESIRKQSADARIVIIGKEPAPPYNRTMLTKMPLDVTASKAESVKEDAWFTQNNVELLSGKAAISLDTNAKAVTLDDGSSINYGKCVLATGAESMALPITGINKAGVVGLRTAQDIYAIRQILIGSKRAVVIGGGLIGIEIAWELKKAGAYVTVLEGADYLMKRVIDEETAVILQDMMEQRGIHVVTGAKIKAVEGDGSVEAVSLEDGSRYEAGLVIVAAGISPNKQIAQEAALTVGRSIVVDSFMRTSAEDVYACGDCAEYQGMNVGTWIQAENQGRIAGTNATGGSMQYSPESPSLFVNALGTSLFCIGDMGKAEGVTYETRTIKGNSESESNLINPKPGGFTYEKYYYTGGKTVGAALIGNLSKIKAVKELVKNKEDKA
ncbi:MAG: FAD-dependent oxidoreductase [Defluviitaleaceae bacterium]|nr:FAD-dependent oxidoreductase [Defluviitaleaceae bacterium]